MEEPLAVGVEIGLAGAALDFVMDGVLNFVGAGDPGIVSGEQSCAQDSAHQNHGQAQAANADAASLESSHLVVLGEDAEGDENGKQDADGERVVNQKRGQEKVVLEDADEGDVVLDDVAQKVKEVEDLGHGDERGEPESEVKEEVRQDVGIHELEHGEPNAGTG